MIGATTGLVMILRRKQRLGVKIPYGPFLALAAILWLLFGDTLVSKYLFNKTS